MSRADGDDNDKVIMSPVESACWCNSPDVYTYKADNLSHSYAHLLQHCLNKPAYRIRYVGAKRLLGSDGGRRSGNASFIAWVQLTRYSQVTQLAKNMPSEVQSNCKVKTDSRHRNF